MSSRDLAARSRIARCSPLSCDSLKHAKDAVKANQLTAAPSAGNESENDSKKVIQDPKMARRKAANSSKTRSSKRIRDQAKPMGEDSTVKLLDLPIEMLAMIADFLDGKDLLVLRLTHNLLTAAADDAFARAFFTHRKHLFTNYSLKVLANITFRPNWVRKMRTIEFCTVELDRKKFGSDRSVAGKHRTRGAERRETIYAKFDEETQADDGKQNLLCTILDMLDDLPEPVEIALSPGFNPNSAKGYFGLSELLGELDAKLSVNDLMPGDCNKAFMCLVMAMHEVDFAPAHCSFTMADLELSSFDSLLHNAPTCPEMWSFLVMLDLGLDHPRHMWHAPHTLALEAFFAEATNLMYLSLQFNNDPPLPSSPEANCIKWLLGATAHMKLDHLSLMEASTNTADLVALATAQADQLRRLRLNAINLPNSECWSAVFSSLKELDLDTLSIDRLTTGPDEDLRLLVDDKGEEQIEVEGKESVMKALDELTNDPYYIEI
ncbi:hypothetical protein PRZ48_007788 [Zasmidium cellare]|uniref:F-box domain-containing protein n=1 Tax=Zasmidium cellare TaxID=395010 RepID=A0ABR0EL87_ZASCE|nr:hypothetical protein PRZ48_007788 [Zasmidium cellare]